MDDVTAFEAGEISPADFPHERHVRVAWGLAQRYDRDEALAKMIAGIKALAARAGVPGKYHETITRAWFELVAPVDDLEAHPELFERGLLAQYYSPERLSAGRAAWLEPDLQQLPGR